MRTRQQVRRGANAVLVPMQCEADRPDLLRDPRFATNAARIQAAGIPGLRGFVGIDLVWHAERGPVVIVSRYGILDGVWNIVFVDWIAICSTLVS